MSSTRISRRVNAPRAIVYRALLDVRAVATWKVPTGMTNGFCFPRDDWWKSCERFKESSDIFQLPLSFHGSFYGTM